MELEQLTSLLIVKDLEIKTLQERIKWLEERVDYLNTMLDSYKEELLETNRQPIGFRKGGG